jgi:cbb3-type cytochrome oxidase maturation protein
MSVLFIVLPVAVLSSALAAVAFVWATRRGQFDDLKTPALRVLTDELDERRPAAPEVSSPRRV